MIGNRDLEIESIIEDLGIEKGYARFRLWVNEVLEATKCSRYTILLNGENNFRYELATLLPYKGNRTAEGKPKLLEEIKKFVTDNYEVESVDHLESDDLLSAKQDTVDGTTIIVCQDKDLNMCPGWRYHTGKKKLEYITEEAGRLAFYSQLLSGDPVDNIPGLYGVGPKTIEKLLAKCKTEADYYKVVLKEYKDKRGNPKQKWKTDKTTEEVVWEIGNLLWMHRTTDVDERWEAPIG